MSDNASTALAVTSENHNLPATLQAVPTVSSAVTLDRANLVFMANMIEGANLVPYDKSVSREVQKARVMAKIVAGVAHNFDPVSAQENLHIIQNRCVLSARGMSIKLRRTGRYDTRVKQLDDQGCILDVLEKNDQGKWIVKGTVRFLRSDAEAAGLTKSNAAMYEKWGPDMFFANAIKRVCRRFAPEVLDTQSVIYDTAARPTEPPPLPPQPTPNAIGSSASEPSHQPQGASQGAPPAPSFPTPEPPRNEVGQEYQDEVYTEEDVAAAVVAEEVAASGDDDGFTPAGEESAIDAEPIDSDESRLEDLRMAAKELYTESDKDQKKAIDKWLGQRTISTLTANELSDLLETFSR